MNNKEEQEVDTNVNEWSLKKILIRLVAYPFCLFMVGAGVFLLLRPINWKSGFAGIGLIYFGTFYLYIDLKIILKKSNHKN
ncbi:MAG: hypothetical protein LBI82_02155 [Dysgonamonadaceae bacterium]|jgi:hypothetical protein|nr:hypothetical protein [Dysgonamonadaceae bacterium]